MVVLRRGVSEQYWNNGILRILALSLLSILSIVWVLFPNDDHNRRTSTEKRIGEAPYLSWNGPNDEFTLDKMVINFEEVQIKFWDKLQRDYGADNVARIFQSKANVASGRNISVGRALFSAPSKDPATTTNINTNNKNSNSSSSSTNTSTSDSSWDRLKRKVMQKILRAHLLKQRQPFVWSTGGHSVAAGHGNLFNESYTHVLNQASKSLFQAVGVDFIVRPYGMGNTHSGMELASCVKEIYGPDSDVLTWDFAMSDKSASLPEYYFYRAAAQFSNYPAFVGLRMEKFAQALEEMKQRGFAAFQLDEHLSFQLQQELPDTAGKTQDEINQMPSHVRSFRCGKTIETGQPSCGTEKYTVFDRKDHSCNERLFRVSWHPGWKWHALYGNFLSLFLMEIVSDALSELQQQKSLLNNNRDDAQALLDQLIALDEEDYALFTAAPVPGNGRGIKGLENLTDISRDVLYKQKNYCHTARLPSEFRYRGILTSESTAASQRRQVSELSSYLEAIRLPTEIVVPENMTVVDDKTSIALFDSLDTFDKGVELHELGKQRKVDLLHSNLKNLPMHLSWNKRSRLHFSAFCENILLHVDHHDFFVADAMGWSKLVLPIRSEIEAYRNNDNHQNKKRNNDDDHTIQKQREPLLLLQGYIAMCLVPCNHRYCNPAKTFTFKKPNDDQGEPLLSMTVNDIAVTSFSVFGEGCFFLKHPVTQNNETRGGGGGHKWKANANGQYEIRARTNDPRMVVKFSSFMMW